MAEFIKVTYTGRDKDTNQVFDTNDESVAKAENIYNPQIKYEPVLMILGDNQLIKGFEEAFDVELVPGHLTNHEEQLVHEYYKRYSSHGWVFQR